MDQRTGSGARILFLIALSCACAAAVLEYYQTSNTVEWVSFNDATKRAGEKGKLIYVDFYADWCQPCKQMDRTTFANDSVVALLSREFIAVRINIDDPVFGQPMKKRFNIEAMPTAILMSADRQEVRRKIGYMNAEEFTAWLKEAN